MEQITILYLSWKRVNILEQTLMSHFKNGLKDFKKIIFFQEISEEDKIIASKYNCECIGNADNIGILSAFIELIKNCKTDYFIFCENDWNLIENQETTNKILEDSLNLSDKNIIVRLRHRKNPGKPLYSRPKNVNEWINTDINSFPYKLESLSWINKPIEIYSSLEEIKLNYIWYITTLEHQRWSNNIFMSKTEHFKKIIDELQNYKYTDKYLGLEDVLINKLKIDLKIAGGEGLFTHLDYINDKPWDYDPPWFY